MQSSSPGGGCATLEPVQTQLSPGEAVDQELTLGVVWLMLEVEIELGLAVFSRALNTEENSL